MSSYDFYREIYRRNIGSIRQGENECDEFLSTEKYDSRLGISLIIPIKIIKEQYDFLIKDLKRIEPNQYYYPFEDLHITVFDYIKGSENYQRNKSLETQFMNLSRIALAKEDEFDIEIKGLVFSRAAGMLTGYDRNKLVLIRETIRKLMKDYEIRNDERYESGSAHVTFVRFKKRITRISDFCGKIKKYEDEYFGVEKINEMQLVEHDWYNTNKKKRIIERIKL